MLQLIRISDGPTITLEVPIGDCSGCGVFLKVRVQLHGNCPEASVKGGIITPSTVCLRDPTFGMVLLLGHLKGSPGG
jgi:hypothetical protein